MTLAITVVLTVLNHVKIFNFQLRPDWFSGFLSHCILDEKLLTVFAFSNKHNDKMTLCIPVPGGITVILSKLESTYLRNWNLSLFFDISERRFFCRVSAQYDMRKWKGQTSSWMGKPGLSVGIAGSRI